ncbi:MAG: hypothetical protein AABZ60_07170 [Planctomycetota bacterium]
MEGGIRKTIILTVDSDLYSELKIISSAEEKTVEELLQNWIQNLVKNRGSTQMINSDDLEKAKRELKEARESIGKSPIPSPIGAGLGLDSALKAPNTNLGIGLGSSGDTGTGSGSKTRFIRNVNEAVSVKGLSEETIVFFCGFCFQKCRIPKQYIGQKVDCPRCRNPLQVPERSSTT